MEAMSIESLILSAWEEEGYVGRNRVPVGRSDVDVLAVHATKKAVRIGESKVTDGSQTVHPFDTWNAEEISSGRKDFLWWLGAWSNWLENLPLLWHSDGRPAIPWIIGADVVNEIEVVLCGNAFVFGSDKTQLIANKAVQATAITYLRRNAVLDEGISKSTILIRGRFISTADLFAELVRAVFRRIDEGYGRRFGEPVKDVVRELHRYLQPDLYRIPRGPGETRLCTKKEPFQFEIRKHTVLRLFEVFGITLDEVRKMVAVPSSTDYYEDHRLEPLSPC